jgi:hypothetical protein
MKQKLTKLINNKELGSSYVTDNEEECRECEGTLELEMLCQDHCNDLVRELDNYTDIDIIKMVVHPDKLIENAWRDYVIKSLINGDERREYLECGHSDEGFDEFVINSFWYTNGIDPSERLNFNYKYNRSTKQFDLVENKN